MHLIGIALLMIGGIAFISGRAASAAKSDFRGLRTGMSVAQAETAAASNGMACETGFTGLTTCRGGDASVVLTTTGRDGDLIWELQVSLAGHFDATAMEARLEAYYGLSPTPTPHVYTTASGEELMLLEIGATSTVFYLRNPKVLNADPAALPPPKL